MSEAFQDPEQTEGVPAGLPTDGQPQNAEPAVDEFRQRVEQGGEYAWEQIQKRDRHSSTLANRVKALEPIEQLVNFAGGSDQLLELAQMGTRIQQNPDLYELVQKSLRSGRVELPQVTPNAPAEDDEWIDPDVKKYRDETRESNRLLREELAELRDIAGHSDLEWKQTRVKENIDKALSIFAGDEEAFEEAKQVFGSQYKMALAAAQRGDKTQLDLVDKLASPGGDQIIQTVTMPVYMKHAAKLVAASNTQSAVVNGALMRSTDEKNRNPSRPGTPQLPHLPKGRVSDSYVLDVLKAAKRQKGLT